MSIPKSIKNAYQNYQSKQTAKQALHIAKRQVGGEAGRAERGGKNEKQDLADATSHMDRILQNTRDGKVLHKHGKGIDNRVTDHSSSPFTLKVRVANEQKHAFDVVKNIAKTHLRFANTSEYRALANRLNTLLEQSGNKKQIEVTADIRNAVHDINEFVKSGGRKIAGGTLAATQTMQADQNDLPVEQSR